MLVCIQAYHWEAKRMVENEQSFGEYLRQLIRDSGITQHKFYTELGIRKPYFYDILAHLLLMAVQTLSNDQAFT